jgi:FkbM family methyltransferase
MFGHLKSLIKTQLSLRGYHLHWATPGTVIGNDLTVDIPALLPPKGAVCFDVGANVGQTLDWMTQKLRVPIIHAFEPTPTVFAELERRSWSANVHLHAFALGSAEGSTNINLYELPVLNSLLPLGKAASNHFHDVKAIGMAEVRVSTVDSFCTAHNIEVIDLLKIDTQGFDFEVLKGSKRLLSQGRVGHVLVELNFIELYDNQCSPWEVEAFLASHGFRLVELYEKTRHDHSISWCTGLFRGNKA